MILAPVSVGVSLEGRECDTAHCSPFSTEPSFHFLRRTPPSRSECLLLGQREGFSQIPTVQPSARRGSFKTRRFPGLLRGGGT